ncbi:hypothetical protein Tco_1252550 [Tanacetum coccineum]
MVLSSTYSTPPTRYYSRDALEKMAALVDELATMVHAFCSSTAVLEVISQQHTTQNTNTTTVKVTTTIIPNESNDHTDNTKTDIRKTKTDVITKTTSLITIIREPDQTVTPFFTASSSSIAKIENNVASQSPTVSLFVLPAPLTNLIHKSSKVQQEIVIFRSTKLHQTSALATLIESMSSNSPCLETIPPGHRCGPPKIVFLQNEPEPPWKPHDTRYKAMSLEDKTRFQARSIDMIHGPSLC